MTYTPDKGSVIPFKVTASEPPINVFTSVQWTCGGAQANTVNLTYTAWTGFQTQSFSLPLSGFPTSISLRTGSAAVIIVGAALASNPGVAAVFSLPLLQVVYGSGSTLQTGGQGTGVFTLQTGRKFTNLTLTGSLAAYAPAAVAQTVVTITVWAQLLGRTSS